MVIPYKSLEPDTLVALIQEFVTRSGAVHGHADFSADQMTQAVMKQLASGAAIIVFDEEDESCTIVETRGRVG